VAIDDNQVEKIVREVVNNLFASAGSSSLKTSPVSYGSSDSGNNGLFEKIEDAIAAAKIAQKKYVSLGRNVRFTIVEAIRKAALADKEKLA
jgi:hypothetical protein